MKNTKHLKHRSAPHFFSGSFTNLDGNRSGATLTEILMSLLVMGVGLTSVAAMFPVSMLRSIQATKLTNGALLRHQCEEYFQAFPRMSTNNFDTGYPVFDQSISQYANEVDNVLGNVEFTGRSVVWERHSVRNIAELRSSLPLNVVSVIDPLGVQFASTVGQARSFGKDPYGLHSVPEAYFAADRKNGGFNMGNTTAQLMAASMFESNDSWKGYLSSIEVNPSTLTATSAELLDVSASDLLEFQTAASPSGIIGRIVLFDVTGKQSHVSPVTGVSGQTVNFANPLPNNGLNNAISEVRLELLESRYSCILTLRKQLVSFGVDGQPGVAGEDDDNSDADNDPGTAADGSNEAGWPGSDDVVRVLGGDLVIFFRRDFSPLAEQVYGVENLNKGQVGLQPEEVRIRWDGSNEDSRPRIRQGGYVFDSRNGFWYQIRTVIAEDKPVDAARLAASPWIDSNNDREAVVILDRSPEATGQFLMVPEGIIEVYDYSSLAE